MATSVSICNMALGRIGITRQIANLTTENSQEAVTCRLYYDDAVRFVLEDYPWPFATKYRSLGLVESAPNSDWQYSYRYPSDGVFIRRIVTDAGRVDHEPMPFKVGLDDEGKVVYTDQPDAVVEYTKLETAESRFTPAFVETLSWKIAADIAPSLSRVASAQQTCLAMYQRMIAKARERVANESQQSEPPDSEFVRARA